MAKFQYLAKLSIFGENLNFWRNLQFLGKLSIFGENLLLLKHMLGINYDALYLVKINAKQRREFLNMLLHYFELHLEGFKKPKSLQVLNDVFH